MQALGWAFKSALLTGGDEDVRLSLIWPAQLRVEPAELVARKMQTTPITLPLVNLRTTLVLERVFRHTML